MQRFVETLPQKQAFYQADFLSADECSLFRTQLLENINWQSRSIRIFGRSVLQPRLMAWYGEADAHYKYSGTTFEPLPWTTELLELKSRVELHLNCKFNSALLNLYRDGQDSMGAHSDDEKELGQNPTIASLSLGATRNFVFRHRKKRLKQSLLLESGSLLVMQGQCQENWKHELPKTRKKVDPRINITFRSILKS